MRHPELDNAYEAGAYISFSPVPIVASAKPLKAGAIAFLIFAGGGLAILAALIATRPYQLELRQAEQAAATAQQEAEAAQSELKRIQHCIAGGQ